jgi:hypothetical protein
MCRLTYVRVYVQTLARARARIIYIFDMCIRNTELVGSSANRGQCVTE